MKRPAVPKPRRLISLLVAALTLYLPCQTSAQPIFYAAQGPEAFDSVVSDSQVLVVRAAAYWGFLPPDANAWKDVGIIYHTATFYDERAYSPIMRQMALSKYPSFVLDLPWSMAFLTPFRADIVRRDFPQVKKWVVAGHGIGGAVASCYAQWRNMDGLALFSSYPFPLFNNLQRSDIAVISLWGNQDGVTSRQQWEDGKLALPSTALFLEIDGGNHSQMAWLATTVNGDNTAAISRGIQQGIVLNQLRILMENIQKTIVDDTPIDDDCIIVSGSSPSDSISYDGGSKDSISSSDSDSGSDSDGDGDTDSSESGDSDSGGDTSSNTISLDSPPDSISFDCGESSDSRDYVSRNLRRRLEWSA